MAFRQEIFHKQDSPTQLLSGQKNELTGEYIIIEEEDNE
jgi:hypothetical protein